jgi:hypothetical protein
MRFVDVAEPAAAYSCMQAIAACDQALGCLDGLLLVAEFELGHRNVRNC